MVIFENYFIGWDGQSKKIIRYDVIDTMENAIYYAERYIKAFFSDEKYDIEKITSEDGNMITFVMTSKTRDASGMYDQEFINVYKPAAKGKKDIDLLFQIFARQEEERLNKIIGNDIRITEDGYTVKIKEDDNNVSIDYSAS